MCELLGDISDSFWAIYYTLVEAFGRYIGGGFWAIYILVEAATEETHCERPPPPPSLILQFRRDLGKGQNFCNSSLSLKLEYVGYFHGKHDNFFR